MNIPNARERILHTAVKIFAEKSFEGSRIEEIAREANVPKSLIYYHFKNKDEILEVLTSNFINEYMSILDTIPNEIAEEKVHGITDRMKNVYYEFGQRNSDLVRVMFIDSLKKSNDKPILFQVIDKMIEKEMQMTTDNNYDIQERRIAEFFTSFIPNYAYVCFAEHWTQYFNLRREEFDKLFLSVYEQTHGAYHKNNVKMNKK